MAAVVQWIVAHWAELAGVVAALLTLASLVTAFTKTPKDDEVVRKIAAWLSFLQPRTSAGTVKPPFSTHGNEVPEAPFSALELEEPPVGPQRLDRR